MYMYIKKGSIYSKTACRKFSLPESLHDDSLSICLMAIVCFKIRNVLDLFKIYIEEAKENESQIRERKISRFLKGTTHSIEL